MKTAIPPHRRAAWLLFAAPALLATPALAQVAPPPVQSTVTPAAEPAAAPQDSAPATPSAAPEAGASRTVIRPEANEVVDEARQRPARAATRTERPRAAAPAERRIARVTETRSPTPAPAAAAPVTQAPATPAPATPAPVAEAPAAPAPVAEPPTAGATTTETARIAETGGTPIWPWIALAAVIVLGLGIFAWRRKRATAFEDQYSSDHAYAEPVYEEPVKPVAVEREVAPVAAAAAIPAAAAIAPRHDPVPAPVAAEEVTVADAGAEDVAALTDGALAKDRPWLEFAMRPVRAGTNVDEALVEIELTVANAGNLPAENVRVSTFMLTDAQAGEVERLLVDPPVDAAAQSVTIQPGEGTRIDATLATLKTAIGVAGSGFTPVVVADARYILPDGTEGRTSASFLVGVPDASGNIAPFAIDERDMRDDVEARLHGEPQRV